MRLSAEVFVEAIRDLQPAVTACGRCTLLSTTSSSPSLVSGLRW